jgi:serine/threonine protein kinase
VRRVVNELHKGGFVHGDIRDTNLLIDRASLPKTVDEVGIHVIDFDWAGLIGQAKYPTGVNTVSVRRPNGAQDGEPITEEHDRQMVSFMFEPISVFYYIPMFRFGYIPCRPRAEVLQYLL